MDNSNSADRYERYEETDFITDPYFQDWVCNPAMENERFWMDFLAQHPDRKERIENVRVFLKKLSYNEDLPGDEQAEQSLRKHLEAIELLEKDKGKVVKMTATRRWSYALRIAALFGGVILLLSIFRLMNKDRNVAVETAYGVLKTVILPDSSQVVLNANSMIEYGKNWKAGKQREIWLNGEAYFDVTHINRDNRNIQPGERFVVHTGNLDVEVLGTSFNIRQRRDKTEVVLKEGKIKVSFKNGTLNDILMKPGDLVAYEPLKNKLEQSSADPEKYSAWKEGKLILANPAAKEIIRYVEDTYGIKILLQDPALGEEIIDGAIPLSNLDDVLFILSTSLNADIIKKKDTLIVQPRK